MTVTTVVITTMMARRRRNDDDAVVFSVNGVQSILQKAETFYSEGKFEMSLVYFHRGQKLMPESQPFRLGIQKAVEAIEKAVGGRKDDNVSLKLGQRIADFSE